MSQLPQGWAECKLGDVTDYGSTVKVEPTEIPDDAWVLELEDIEKDTSRVLKRLTFAERKSKSTKNRFHRGDVLYGKLRPYLNKVVRATDDGFATTEIIPIPPNDCLDGNYLFYWLKHPKFTAYVNSVSHGLNMPRLGTEAGKEAPFVLAPIDEQKRIANKLDNLLSRVDNCRERLDRVPTVLRRFRQSVLAAATSGKITEDWRTESNLNADWQQVTLAEVAADFSYGSSSKSLKVGRIPVLRMGNIQDGILDWSDLVYSIDENEIAKYNLEVGDVLFNRTNSPELVGKTAVYRGEKPAIYAGYLIRVRCTDRLNPDYLNYCLNSPAGRDYCWKVKSDGVSQSNINAKKLAAFEFSLPTMPEQAEIVRRVELMFQFMDSLTSKVRRARGKIDQLTPSVLTKAFRGELVASEVAQADGKEHQYEDAWALLARISASKNQNEKSRKNRPRNPDQPSSKSNTGKAKRMQKIDRETLLAAVIKLKKDQFTFDELRLAIDANYEDLKATWFNLLQEPNTPIRQIFDDATKAIAFKRVIK